jgi:hypothetical protein
MKKIRKPKQSKPKRRTKLAPCNAKTIEQVRQIAPSLKVGVYEIEFNEFWVRLLYWPPGGSLMLKLAIPRYVFNLFARFWTTPQKARKS